MNEPIVLTLIVGQGDREVCVLSLNVTELIERIFASRKPPPELKGEPPRKKPRRRIV